MSLDLLTNISQPRFFKKNLIINNSLTFEQVKGQAIINLLT